MTSVTSKLTGLAMCIVGTALGMLAVIAVFAFAANIAAPDSEIATSSALAGCAIMIPFIMIARWLASRGQRLWDGSTSQQSSIRSREAARIPPPLPRRSSLRTILTGLIILSIVSAGAGAPGFLCGIIVWCLISYLRRSRRRRINQRYFVVSYETVCSYNRCGATNPSGSIFCRRCGQHLRESYQAIPAKLVKAPHSVHQQDLRSMTPAAFEAFCAGILRNAGWLTKLQGGSGDQGVDIVASRNGTIAVFQCKLYSNPVGNKAVQEVYTGQTFHRADFAAVVTNAEYTPSARKAAYHTNVFLLHYSQLNNLPFAKTA